MCMCTSWRYLYSSDSLQGSLRRVSFLWNSTRFAAVRANDTYVTLTAERAHTWHLNDDIGYITIHIVHTRWFYVCVTVYEPSLSLQLSCRGLQQHPDLLQHNAVVFLLCSSGRVPTAAALPLSGGARRGER